MLRPDNPLILMEITPVRFTPEGKMQPVRTDSGIDGLFGINRGGVMLAKPKSWDGLIYAGPTAEMVAHSMIDTAIFGQNAAGQIARILQRYPAETQYEILGKVYELMGYQQ